MGIKAADIAKLAEAQCLGPCNEFKHFAFDSRRMTASVPSCFIAIKTTSDDGHKYISQAIAQGAVVIICSDASLSKAFPHISFIVHDRPEKVLERWAKKCRMHFSHPVLALTGSNGKTIVKEWMYQLLGAPENLHRTPGSFNSALGVPLTLCGLDASHTAAIVEVGIDRPDTMQALAQLVQPDFGVFTTLGDAHGEHFESDDQKFREKWKLFVNCDKIAAHSKWISKAKSLNLHIPEALVWGSGTEWDPKDFGLEGDDQMHAVQNTMSALLGAVLLGANIEEAKARIFGLEPLEMRMNLVSSRDGGYLLEDTYSSDLESLRWAMEELMAQHTPRKWAVLGTLSTPEWTAKAKAMVDAYGVDRQWWVDSSEDLAEVVAQFGQLSLANTTVLIKGQRRLRMERMAATLRNQHHSTWAEVNLAAMRRNMQQFKALLKPETKVMAMVKADAYGMGILEVARYLEQTHVDYLGVAFSQEALLLRAQGVEMPIMVMNAEPTQFNALAAANCEVEVYAIHQLEPFLQESKGENKLKIHIKVDTGMHRLGFEPAAVPGLLDLLSTRANIEVVGVFSHLSSAGDPSADGFTHEQLDQFNAVALRVQESYPNALAHVLNTQGIARFGAAQHQMVRLGIGLYGVGQYQGIAGLEEVLQWKCKISQVKTLKPGESLGYSRAFTADRETQYATLPVGYADGLQRALSCGKGHVLIEGKPCAILGNVCMDMIMVDVSDVEAKPGDEVVILGPGQSASALAQNAGTIAYEILTGVGSRVPRFYLKD